MADGRGKSLGLVTGAPGPAQPNQHPGVLSREAPVGIEEITRNEVISPG